MSLVDTAMETRTIDSHENPYLVIVSNKFCDVQKYLSAANHTYSANIIQIDDLIA
jgi:TRAP-type C4-dicarboxylate transport system substrate-binding protein